ncbi:MAG: serine/threonine protein kinase [Acidobacteria bacterium]|uniref:Serine/threonine protein kinase n=1 Tax=Candidatus Polarisedimenticola svalbardensis TaxID=2886004 RepID=A0A8J6XYJ1_9BACT|nr:serine/threonine protein kinase [Candidatus Polarisedimenticola svalbardensis]
MGQPALDGLLNRRFLLLELLGRGGMGQVYRAFDRLQEKMVAIKIPRPTRATLPPPRRSGPSHPLSQEFRAWAAMRHPNVIRVREIGTVTEGPFPLGTPFLTLENFDSLPVHLATEPGRMRYQDLRSVTVQILHGLSHIHGFGLVHRDMKPGNILLGRSLRGAGRIKITDFGLAVNAGQSEEPGTITGSFPYVAPEGIHGQTVDSRADLYSLGILLYYLSAGALPCRDLDPGAILLWHLNGEPADPGKVRPDLPVRFRSLVRRLTARDREERPTDAGEALFLLGHGSRSRVLPFPAPAPPVPAASPRLALDRTRLGRFQVVRPSGGEGDWTSELWTLSGIHGVACHKVACGRSGGPVALGRLLLDLLLSRTGSRIGRRGKELQETGLPLRLLGRVPIWDQRRKAARRPTGRHPRARFDPAAIARLVLAFCGRAPLALVFTPAALRDRLVADVVIRLQQAGRSGRCGKGLLLVLPRSSRAARKSVKKLPDVVAGDDSFGSRLADPVL